MQPRLGALAILRTMPRLGALQVLLILIGLLCQVPDDQVWRQTENSRNDKESCTALKRLEGSEALTILSMNWLSMTEVINTPPAAAKPESHGI